MKNIVRHFVGRTRRRAGQPLQMGDVLIGELPGEVHIPIVDRPVAVVRQHRVGDTENVLALAAAKNLRVAGRDLLDQAGP